MQAMDVPALYWLAASWGGELGLAGNQLLRLPDLRGDPRAARTRAGA